MIIQKQVCHVVIFGIVKLNYNWVNTFGHRNNKLHNLIYHDAHNSTMILQAKKIKLKRK